MKQHNRATRNKGIQCFSVIVDAAGTSAVMELVIYIKIITFLAPAMVRWCGGVCEDKYEDATQLVMMAAPSLSCS